MIIDLRTDAEINQLPRASDVIINTPLPPLNTRQVCELAETLHEVTQHAPGATYRVFCAKGNRSGLAAAMLKAMGVRVVDLGGVR